MSNLIVQIAQKEAAAAREQQAKYEDISNELTRVAEQTGEGVTGQYAIIGFHYGTAARQWEKVANFWSEVAQRGAIPSRLPFIDFVVKGDIDPRKFSDEQLQQAFGPSATSVSLEKAVYNAALSVSATPHKS